MFYTCRGGGGALGAHRHDYVHVKHRDPYNQEEWARPPVCSRFPWRGNIVSPRLLFISLI